MSRKFFALVFGLLSFNLLFFPFRSDYRPELTIFPFGTVWFFLCTVAIQIFLLILFHQSSPSRKQTYAEGASAVAIIASLLTLFRANIVDQFLLTVLSIGLTAISLYLFSLKHDEFGAITELVALPFRLFFDWVSGGVTAITKFAAVGSVVKESRKHAPKLAALNLTESNRNAVIRGLFLAVPILFVLFFLLTSADPIFAHIIQNAFHFQVPEVPAWFSTRFIFSLMILLFIAPFAWMRTDEKFRSTFQNEAFKNMKIESLILSVSVAVLLGFFLLIQFRYLFTTVSETELRQFGVQTYSEYVKRGFGELLLVSIIVYAIAGMNMVIHRMIDKNESGLIRKANIFLLIEALIFIFSIMRRVWLYQASHGLSRVRVYGMVFLLLMVTFTVILILRHTRQRVINWYVWEIGSVIAVLFFTFLLNTDHLIASTFKPTVNGEVDYVYISRLSPDAVDGWMDAYTQARSVILASQFVNRKEFTPDETRQIVYSRSVIENLIRNRSYLKDRYEGVDFSFEKVLTPEMKRFNFAEKTAYEKAKNSIFGSELDVLNTKSAELVQQISQQNQSVPMDRSSQSPLVH